MLGTLIYFYILTFSVTVLFATHIHSIPKNPTSSSTYACNCCIQQQLMYFLKMYL